MNWLFAGLAIAGALFVAFVVREIRREFTIENLFLDAGDLE